VHEDDGLHAMGWTVSGRATLATIILATSIMVWMFAI
jgi:hypothetical protein